MKKIITLLLVGIVFLPAKLFGKDYDTITRKNGSHFEMLWISGADTCFGEYTIPEELTEKEATDLILGKVKKLEKEDRYSLKTYFLSASCDAIIVNNKVYGINPDGLIKPMILLLLLFSPFMLLLIPVGFLLYRSKTKISMKEIPTG